jgi:hypothetical protein
MSERFRIETIAEIFFKAPVRDGQGHIVPAPPAAQRKYAELKETWLAGHPRLPHEEPMVSLGPVTEEGREGYSVRKEIIYH